MLCVEQDFICLTVNSIDVMDELSSNQEEADTKLLFHSKCALVAYPGKVVVKYLSCDMDITVMFLALCPEEANRIYIYYGAGEARKVLQLNAVEIPDSLKSALFGFHAFSGDDFICAIFRKSKGICWNKKQEQKVYGGVCPTRKSVED